MSQVADKFAVEQPGYGSVGLSWAAGVRQISRMSLAIFTCLVCVLGLRPLFTPFLFAQLLDERAVKVAFVFNLTKYVEWPQPLQEVTIGFVGEGSMGEILQRVLAGKTSEARPVHIVLLPSEQQLQRCNILYIAESSPEKIHAVLEKVRNKNVLTVGDSDSFARNGGMVGLVRTGDQVQIQVNLKAAEESHLKISSRVLDLATIVQGTPGVRN